VDDPEIWRFGLEDPHTGARRGIASLAALVAFVERVLAQDVREASGDGGGAHDA
jgi:hypothetical protein